MKKRWTITLADGRVVERSGEHARVTETGGLMVLDNAVGNGLTFAASATGWISFEPVSADEQPAKRDRS